MKLLFLAFVFILSAVNSYAQKSDVFQVFAKSFCKSGKFKLTFTSLFEVRKA